MPYSSNSELPPAAAHYSDHCKTVFRTVWNQTYRRTGDEGRSFATAHTAARQCQGGTKSMTVANAEYTANPSTPQFKIASGALTPVDGGDGRKRLRTIASSSVEDHGGDIVTVQALERMAASAKGMTIFRNHSHKVPDDVLGSVEKAEVKHAGTDDVGKPIWDLILDVVVAKDAKAEQTYEMIADGTQLGTSIGALIPKGAAQRNDAGGYTFTDLRLMEASIVGIPQNPRSWVLNVVKAWKVAEADPDEDEDTNEGFNEANLASEDDPIEKAVEQAAVTEEAEADAGDTASVENTANDVEKAACPDCGGDASHPKGDCSNEMHKSVEPELVKTETASEAEVETEANTTEDALEEKAVEPDLTTEGAPTITASIDASNEEVEETPAQELAKSVPESAEDDGLLNDTLTKSAEVLADIVKSLTGQLTTMRKQYDAAIEERDRAIQDSADAKANADLAKSIAIKLANTSFGRKAVMADTDLAKDFSRFSGIYGPNVLKMLENNHES